jgi:4-amino-4-deoxy-L-arabinose transferase-like glycosyltransferase
MAFRFPSRLVVALLCVIMAVAVFLRFYRLGANPAGVYEDEAFFANLGFCLLSTGHDFQGVFLPVVSYGHDTAVLPFQAYPVAVSVFVFGFNAFAVRFVPAVCGVLIVLASFLLARLLFDDVIALAAAMLVAVSPFQVTYSRIGLTNLIPMTMFFVLGVCFLLSSFKGGRIFMVLAAVAFGMTFLTYFLAHLFVPVFLLGFHLLFSRKLSAPGLKRWYLLFLLLVGFFFFGSLALTQVSRIAGPSHTGWFSELPSNLLEQLRVLLLPGGEWASPPAPGEGGVLYPFELPFLLLGAFLLLRERNSQGMLVVFWACLALFTGAFTSNVLNGSVRRSLSCAGPVLEIIAAYGLVRLLLFFQRRRRAFWLVAGVCVLSLSLSVCQFAYYYFLIQPASLSAEQVFMTPLRDALYYAESLRDRYDRVVVIEDFKLMPYNSHNFLRDYTSFYLGNETTRCTGLSRYSLGNVSQYAPDGRTLFIVRPYEIENATTLQTFYYSNGDAAYLAVA